MKIIVQVLKISRLHEKFQEFNRLSAMEKMLRISHRIRKLYAKIRITEKDAPILIVWREYGITDGDNPTLDGISKKQFKKFMQELCVNHFNLAILAGSILSNKIYPREKIIPDLQDLYQELAWVGEMEIDQGQNLFWTLEYNEVNKFIHPSEINTVRNTSYFFQKDMEVQRHDKLFPFSSDTHLNDYSLFQPAKKRNFSGVFNFKDHISIGLEICRDHFFGVLKKELLESGKNGNPLMHIIVSDYITLQFRNLCGFYNILVDSHLETRFVVSSQQNIQVEPHEMEVYENDLLNDSDVQKKIEPYFYHPLKNSTDEEEMECINQLEKLQPSLYLDFQYYFALRNAIHSINFRGIQKIMEYKNIETVLNYKTTVNTSILQIASRKNNIAMMQLLLSKIPQQARSYASNPLPLPIFVTHFLEMRCEFDEKFLKTFLNQDLEMTKRKASFSTGERSAFELLLKADKIPREIMISLIFLLLRRKDLKSLDLVRNCGLITQVPDLAPVFKRNFITREVH